MRIPSGVTDQYIYFVAVDATDFTTRETGLSSFTVYRSRNGGAAAAFTTPTINEVDATNMPGVYELLLDEDMTIDSGDDSQEMAFHITHAGMHPVTRTIELYRPKITAGQTLTVGSGNANSAVQSIAANAITATAIASNAITSAKIAASAIGASQIATDAITAAKIAADAIGASELAADAVAEIADAVWDELQSGHVSAGSFGEIATEIANILVDTAEIGAAGAGLTAVPWNASWDAEVQSEVDDALVARGLHYLMNTALPTNWATDITANSALDYLADDGTASYDRTTDSLQAIADSGGGGPTAAQIADAVWDEAQSGHVGAGTFGEIATEIAEVLTDTGTTLPATLSTIAGYIDTEVAAIKAVTDNLPDSGALSSLATAAALATAQADLDIITGASGVVIANGSITDASFDTTAGDFVALGVIDQGQAQAVAAGSITLRAAFATTSDDDIVGAIVWVYSGTNGVWQARAITAWNNTTKVASVDNWTTALTGTILYKVFAAPPAPTTAPDVNVTQINGAAVTGDGDATPWDAA